MKIIRSLQELVRSPHIHLALVTGGSLIALTLVSKKVLSAPMKNIWIITPGLFMVAAEAAMETKTRAWYANPYCYVVASVLATVLIIVAHLV